MNDLAIRPGTTTDLTTIMEIWYANEMHDLDPAEFGGQIPPCPAVLPDYPHLLATGKLWIAELHGKAVGFSGVVQRGNSAFLTDLFVHPDLHAQGLGQQLLAQAFDPYAGISRFTVSSSDPRALALYIRYGMQPTWPNFLLRSHYLAIRPNSAAEIVVEEANPADPSIAEWDTEIAGRPRLVDHTFWISQEAGVPLWLKRHDQQLGYAFVRFQAGTAWFPSAARIGPVGVLHSSDATACVLATIRWAASHAEILRIDLPGLHPALAAVLAAGFRIQYVETYMLAAKQPLFDPTCYLGSGGALF